MNKLRKLRLKRWKNIEALNKYLTKHNFVYEIYIPQLNQNVTYYIIKYSNTQKAFRLVLDGSKLHLH